MTGLQRLAVDGGNWRFTKFGRTNSSMTPPPCHALDSACAPSHRARTVQRLSSHALLRPSKLTAPHKYPSLGPFSITHRILALGGKEKSTDALSTKRRACTHNILSASHISTN